MFYAVNMIRAKTPWKKYISKIIPWLKVREFGFLNVSWNMSWYPAAEGAESGAGAAVHKTHSPFHTSNVRAADLHTVFDFYGVQFWCVGKSNYMCFCQQCWWCAGPEGRGGGARPRGPDGYWSFWHVMVVTAGQHTHTRHPPQIHAHAHARGSVGEVYTTSVYIITYIHEHNINRSVACLGVYRK